MVEWQQGRVSSLRVQELCINIRVADNSFSGCFNIKFDSPSEPTRRVMPFGLEIELEWSFMGTGTRNMHKRLLLLGTTKHNFFYTNCNSGGIMDSINVFDSPPPEEAYCFIGRFQLHVIPFRCAFLTVAPNDTRTCHIHLIACTTFPPPSPQQPAEPFRCVNHFLGKENFSSSRLGLLLLLSSEII